MGSGASSLWGGGNSEQPQVHNLSPNDRQYTLNGTHCGSTENNIQCRDERDLASDELTDRILSSGHVQQTPCPDPPSSARSGVSDNAAVAEMFAHTAMSLGMDNEDLLFNLMYFGEHQNGTLGSVMEGVQQETLALHSENNTPYKLKPASASEISGLHRKIFGVNIVSKDCECQVCKDDIDPDSAVLQLPLCQHFFHEECLLRWIKLQGWCPVCRSDIAAKVVETVREELKESPSMDNDGGTCGTRSEGPSFRLFDCGDAGRADDCSCDRIAGGEALTTQRSPRNGGNGSSEVNKPPGQSSIKSLS